VKSKRNITLRICATVGGRCRPDEPRRTATYRRTQGTGTLAEAMGFLHRDPRLCCGVRRVFPLLDGLIQPPRSRGDSTHFSQVGQRATGIAAAGRGRPCPWSLQACATFPPLTTRKRRYIAYYFSGLDFAAFLADQLSKLHLLCTRWSLRAAIRSIDQYCPPLIQFSRYGGEPRGSTLAFSVTGPTQVV